MKNILIILCLFFSLHSQSQTYHMSTDTQEEVKKISSQAFAFLLQVEDVLDYNNTLLQNENTNIQNPAIEEMLKQSMMNLEVNNQSKLKSIICLSCYNNVWKNQQLERDLLIRNEKYDRDQLYQIQNEIVSKKDQEQKKEINSTNQDSIPASTKNVLTTDTTSNTAKGKEAYVKFGIVLYGLTNNPYFSVFRGIDINYVRPRFDLYLQEIMHLHFASKTKSKNKITDKYTHDQEYLNVVYTYERHEDLVGALGDGLSQVTHVEITGSRDLITRLFVKYWDEKINFEGPKNKKGIYATKQFLNDKIVLEFKTPTQYKITIIKGNFTIDYNGTYGINLKTK